MERDRRRVAPGTPDRTWAALRLATQSWYAPLSRLRVYGRDRVPPRGPCVLAMNHVGVVDPILIGMACPRTVHYMAKTELFEIPVLGRLLPLTGAFAVRRGESDREAIRLAREVVRDGHCLGVFVEGTRQARTTIGPVQPGAAMVALSERVPLVPVCFAIPSDRPFDRGTVAFGAAVDLRDLRANAGGYRVAVDRIGTELRALRDFIRATERAGRPRRAEPPLPTPR